MVSFTRASRIPDRFGGAREPLSPGCPMPGGLGSKASFTVQGRQVFVPSAIGPCLANLLRVPRCLVSVRARTGVVGSNPLGRKSGRAAARRRRRLLSPGLADSQPALRFTQASSTGNDPCGWASGPARACNGVLFTFRKYPQKQPEIVCVSPWKKSRVRLSGWGKNGHMPDQASGRGDSDTLFATARRAVLELQKYGIICDTGEWRDATCRLAGPSVQREILAISSGSPL